MNQWYYAVGKERKGPITETEFEDLKNQGIITATTLVWKQGMEQWVMLSQAENQIASQPGLTISTTQGRCVHSNKIYEKAEMFQYGVHWVANEHREAFLQSLREGRVLPTEIASAGGVVYGGFWWRFLGNMLDGMVVGLISCFVIIPLVIVFGGLAAAGAQGAAREQMESLMAGGNVIFQVVSNLAGLVIKIIYETLMVGGKNQGTLGKMALGFKVTKVDFSKLSYGRAAWRSFCKHVINYVCVLFVMALYLGIGVLIVGVSNLNNIEGLFKEGMPTWMIIYLCFAPFVWLLAMFPFWMAGVFPEKAALHDRIAGTRVIRK